MLTSLVYIIAHQKLKRKQRNELPGLIQLIKAFYFNRVSIIYIQTTGNEFFDTIFIRGPLITIMTQLNICTCHRAALYLVQRA